MSITTLSQIKTETPASSPPPVTQQTAPEAAKVTSGQTASASHLNQVVELDKALEGTESAKIPITTSVLTDNKIPGAPSPSTGAPQPIGGHSLNVGGLMSGKLVTQLMDAIIPALATALLYKLAKIRLKKSELQLSAKEIDIIAPIMQDCLNTVNANMSSPWQSLAVALLVLYGSKIGEKSIMQWIDKMKEPEPEKEAPEPVKTPDQVIAEVAKEADNFTEAEIEAVKKKSKVSRERAILFLKKQKQAKK